MTPVPRGLVNTNTWPALSPALVTTRSGCTTPVTLSPYLSSGSSTECPPASTAPASCTASMPPRRISRNTSTGRSFTGKQQMFMAVRGRPPMA